MLICSLALFCAAVGLSVAGSGVSKTEKPPTSSRGGRQLVNKSNKTLKKRPFGVIYIPKPKDGALVNIIVYSSLAQQPMDTGVYNKRAELIKRRYPPY